MQLLHTIASPFESDSDSWGGSVKGNGDINGDGFNDIIISGRPIDSGLGRRDVYIYLGGQTLSNTADFIITDPSSPGPYHWFGSSIAYNGDINGDGFSDLASISLFTGSLSTQDVLVKIFLGGYEFSNQVDGTYSFDQDYTWPVMFMDGDINRDGFDDLILNKSTNKILFGNANLPDSFDDLISPVIGSRSAYYASSVDTTFVANIRGTVNPYSMEYFLSSYLSDGQLVNDYQYSYNPDPINACAYGYFLGDVNNDGGIELLVTNRINNEVFFYVVSTHSNPDSIDDNYIISPIQSLSVFPNPFTQSSTLSYELKEPGMIGLAVYNIKGQLVAKLDDGYKRAGQNSANWDGKDKQGRKLPSGIYLLKLKLNDTFIKCKKVTLCY